MQPKESAIPPTWRTRSPKERELQSPPTSQPPQAPPTLDLSPLRTSEEWRAHWQTQGQLWRTEPEIDEERQKELAERHTVTPDVKKGIYPFGGMKLTRADIEWLLATHENGRGPVDWSDESQRQRKGLDLRGADLRGSEDRPLGLGGLPLARLVGYLSGHEQHIARAGHYEEQGRLACVILTGAYLREAHLEGAYLVGAYLGRANLRWAILREAIFNDMITYVDVRLADKDHTGPCLADVQWGTVNLTSIDWSQMARLGDEHKARQKHDSVRYGKGKWQRLDEYKTAARAYRQLSVVLRDQGLNEDAARFAYRAQVLQKSVHWFQMNLDNISQSQRVRALGSWLFSWFLFLLAGYGYKPLRSFLAYVLVIAGFATAYYLLGVHQMPAHALSWYEAIVVSMTAFHGRGFFVGTFSPGDPQALVGAIEAFFGLLIEVKFIATLTQRLFSR